MFTGDEMGVMNAADAASATIIANGYGEAFKCWARLRAMGAISTAVTVFEMKRPINAVSPKRAAKSRRTSD